MNREDFLDLKNRQTIYYYILRFPGLNLSELSRKLTIPKSTLDYHLIYLKKRGLITTSTEGSYTRFYASEKMSSREKKILNLLREKIPRKIILLILMYPQYFSQINLSKYLKKRPATISYHLDKLVKMDIIEPVNVPNGNKKENNGQNLEEVYDDRFRLMFNTPLEYEKEAKKYLNKNRKEILTKLNGADDSFKEKHVPNGNEITYKIAHYTELYEFLIRHKDSIMDEELDHVLEWVEDWHEKGADFFIKVLSDIFPGICTTFFP